jgi:hypothetical protein
MVGAANLVDNPAMRSLYGPALARLVAAACLLAPAAAWGQGDGARNYQLVPDGARSLTLFAIYARGNQAGDPSSVVQGAEIDAYVAYLQYTRAVSLSGNQVQLFAQLPYGEARGTARLANGTAVSSSSSGMGDLQLGALLGLVGSPALKDKAYADYRPGFTLGALAKLSVPTGEYDFGKPINIGANRWALQLGAPIVQYLGDSFSDPSLASFELTPSITFFTKNDAPHGASSRSQDPLGKLEGHVTRNLGRRWWVSADAFYAYGGETVTDQVRDNNAQRWVGLGATAGFVMNDSLSATLTYGKVARRDAGGVDARAVRADVVFSF